MAAYLFPFLPSTRGPKAAKEVGAGERWHFILDASLKVSGGEGGIRGLNGSGRKEKKKKASDI